MKRVCVVVTARPSYSRVKTVLAALKERRDVELQVIAAGAALVTRYGSVVDQIRDDGFPVAWEVPSVVEGGGTREAALSTGLLLSQLAGGFDRLEPDVVVTVADRHETLATAIAASYQNIPLCHIQGGEVSGSIDDKVRNAVTQLADIHCVATQTAYLKLINDLGLQTVPGIPIHLTGCPGIDLAAEAMKLGPLPGKRVVVLQHPDTTESLSATEQMRSITEAVKGMHGPEGIDPLDVLWFWPGEDAGADEMSKELRMCGVHPVRNMEPVTFLRTLMGSGVLVGNSSVGIRECSFLGVPVVNIGRRQEGRERGGNVADVDYDVGAIRAAVKAQMGKRCPVSNLYGDGKAGQKIAEILVNGAAEAAA